MQSFHEIIQNIRPTSMNAKQADTRFEVLSLRWFLSTPLYETERGWLRVDFAILELILRVIEISVRKVRIVKGLPMEEV